jgi:hypothetical protein
VTLDEVFAVVGAKRVPLAPELAGYLVLEIAEHADPSGGDVDPEERLRRRRRNGRAGQAESEMRAPARRKLRFASCSPGCST